MSLSSQVSDAQQLLPRSYNSSSRCQKRKVCPWFDAVSCTLCFASVVPLFMFSQSLFEQLEKDLDESGAESETSLPVSCWDLQKLDADGHCCNVVPDAKVCDSEHVAKVTTPLKKWFCSIRELTTESKNNNNHPKHASGPSLRAYIEAIGAIAPSTTDDLDGKSSSAGEQRSPSPTDSMRTLVYDAYGENAFRDDYGSPDSYIEAIAVPITDDLDGRSTCAHEQRPPSPTDSEKTLVYDAYEHGYTSPAGSPYRHVNPCGDAADPSTATDDLDGRSTCAHEQRPPSPTDSVKTLVYDAYEHGYTSPAGSRYRHVKPWRRSRSF